LWYPGSIKTLLMARAEGGHEKTLKTRTKPL
jgi:hypothetical protein